MWDVEFETELVLVLPLDIPHRERLIQTAAQHLRMIVAANEYMNLTRISHPREAAIKHVYDSVAPWRHFCNAKTVLDVGTGAGFPGIPLSIVLPDIRFLLFESVHKKARFLDAAVKALALHNVRVIAERAEHSIASLSAEIITARAVAPMSRILDLFGSALNGGTRLMLYKGPNVDTELKEARKRHLAAEVVCSYELPGRSGTRTLVQIQAQPFPRSTS